MKLSAKAEYACIAMLELAASYGSNEPVQIRRIAEQHGIPQRFLVQILLQLKGAGLVASTRGAAGGYRLIRAPDDVTLGEVMEVIEGSSAEAATPAASADSPAVSVLHEAWHEAAAAQREVLDGLSFAQLVERTRARGGNMYYI